MKIVIIEDERLTAEDLAATILKVEPQAQIVKILSSVKESMNYFSTVELNIDLIFSDIQLGDGSSFEIFEKVHITCPVIFCTAYDQYALKAFEINSIHYLLKPFDIESVKTAFEKYDNLKETLSNTINTQPTLAITNSTNAQYGLINSVPDSIRNLKEAIELLKKEEAPKSVLVYHKDKILPIKLENVALFHIEDNITKLLTFDNISYALNKSMEELETLCSNSFFRVNRQFLVNRVAIIDTSQYFNRKLVVNLSIKVNEKVIVSKAKAPTFLNWLTS